MVEILAVERVDVAGTGVLDFVIDAPTPGATSDTHVLTLQGWVLGETGPIRELIIHEHGCDVRRFPLNAPRPDALAAFPRAPEQQCGFNTFLAYLGAGRTITYTLLAGMPDGREVPLCHVTARVGALVRQESRLQPLMLTTLGRSGSTYVMGVLSRHRQIVAYRPFEYEARVARYWVDVFSALAQPGSYLQSIIPTAVASPHWWLGRDELTADPHLPDKGVMTYLAGDGIDSLASVCANRIDAFYAHLAGRREQADARFFAEKCLPDRCAALMRSLFPGRREIVLVRDLRDMVCSILAFNRKRGFDGFGRGNVESDEQYMNYLCVSVQQLLEAVRAGRQDGTMLLLRYEDFIPRPRETLRTVLRFLELERDDSVLDELLAPAPPEVLGYHRTSMDAASSIGRWRVEFTDAMKWAFVQHLEKASLELGYEPTPLPRTPSEVPVEPQT